jgi:hypothetical protein
MASSGMLRRVALLRTDVSVELSASIIRMTRIQSRKLRLTTVGDRRPDHATPLYPQKLALNFAEKWQSLSRYSSLVTKSH